MQTVYTRGSGCGSHREVADGADVVFTDTGEWRCNFYSRDTMPARVIVITTCLSVRLSGSLSVRHAPVLCQNEES